jgi:hypothetical protein
MICPHAWNQGESGKAIEKKALDAMHNPIRMGKFGIPSTWFDTFHTCGCKIADTDTIYYCDNIEVGRHATLPLSKQKPPLATRHSHSPLENSRRKTLQSGLTV